MRNHSGRWAAAALLCLSASNAGPAGSRQAQSVFTIAANGTAIAIETGHVDRGAISRIEHRASPQGAISNIRLVEANWYYGQDMAAHDGPARQVRAWLEYPRGKLHPVGWATGDVLTIGRGAHAVSRPVSVVIPSGARFWTRWMNAGLPQTEWPLQVLPAAPAQVGRTDGWGSSQTAFAPDKDRTAFFGPAAIIGTVWHHDARGAIIVGDSIAFGTGDVSGSGVGGGSGYLARAIDPLFAYTKMTRPGQRAADVAAEASGAPGRFIALLSYSDVIFEHGLNDLRLGRAPAQVGEDQRIIRSRFRRGARKWQVTLTPRTLSNDGYRSESGQTAKTDGTMTSLSAVNGAIRASGSNSLRVVDAADAAMTARDSGIWSGPWPPVSDGTHPTSAKAEAMANALRSVWRR